MSWSSDFIWMTAIRKDLEEGFVVLSGPAPCALKGISITADPMNDKRTITYRDIFIACKPPRRRRPIIRTELSTCLSEHKGRVGLRFVSGWSATLPQCGL